jgi:O-methyltransferase/methyltransferase family protein
MAHDARADIMALASGAWRAQALYAAAKLGIADLLRDGPKPASTLAAACGADPDALFRLMRALVSIGVFACNPDGSFTLTAASELLRSDTAGSLRDYAIMQGERWTWQSWGEIEFSVRTGRPAFEHVFGAPLFEYYNRHPEAGQVSAAALNALSAADNDAVASTYPFPRTGVVVDVGGGRGSLLGAILSRRPGMRGVLFERGAVAEAAAADLAVAGLQARCEAVGGDFFSEIPAGGDVYVLKKVLHDWQDKQARAILQACRAAMNQTARLLIAEFVLPNNDTPSAAKWLDLLMLVYAGGRERTEAEYGDLLASAGFSIGRVISTKSGIGLLEGRPV